MRPIRSITLTLMAGLAFLMVGVIGLPTQAAASTTTLLPVKLGNHSFGHLRSPEAIVAKAGPDDVGWYRPQEGPNYGPWSFDVARDGSIWLLDEINHRLLEWSPDRADRPARTVPLPFKAPVNLAVGANGTVYVTAKPAGTPQTTLYALTPTGQVRWTAPLLGESFGGALRVGADGVLYHSWASAVGDERGWAPATTPAGQPLPVAEQRQRSSPDQPLSDGLRLRTAWQGPHEVRFSLVNQAGQVVRAWQVTSRTDIGGALTFTPELVGGDPVVALEVSQRTTTKSLWEYLVLRLAPDGSTRLRFTLDPAAVWREPAITGLRVGPDAKLYQLRTSPTTGVSIARYSLDPVKTTPPTTTTPAGVVPPSTLTPPPATSTPAPTVTAPSVQPQPTTAPSVQPQPASRSVLPWVMAVAVPALLAAVVGGWLWYRRRHPASPQRHGRSRPAH